MSSEDDEREARSPSQDITNVINTTALDAAAALAQTQPETSMLEAPAGDNGAVDNEEDDKPTQEIPRGQEEEPGQLQPQDAVSDATEMAKQKGRVDFDMNEDAERGPRTYGSAAASRRDSVNSSITERRHEFFCLEVDVCYTPVDARPKRMSELRVSEGLMDVGTASAHSSLSLSLSLCVCVCVCVVSDAGEGDRRA